MSAGPKRRTDVGAGHDAIRTWRAEAGRTPRAVLAVAVRFSLEELAHRVPGNSVEVRVPPFGVVQCVPGPRHTRGTPANVVETDAQTWLRLVTGADTWAQAAAAGAIAASGTRADVSGWLPLFPGGQATLSS